MLICKIIGEITQRDYLTTLILLRPITSVLNLVINLFSTLSKSEQKHDLIKPSLKILRLTLPVLIKFDGINCQKRNFLMID